MRPTPWSVRAWRARTSPRSRCARSASAAPGALPPLDVRIHKRIPVAAGLGGGSADAAAALRAANRIAGAPLDADAPARPGRRLGSDVPSQVEPGHAIVTGTGEIVEPIELPPVDVVLVPHARGLSAGEVYAELDRRRGLARTARPGAAAAARRGRTRARSPGVLENDLGPGRDRAPARTCAGALERTAGARVHWAPA